jgi:predicted ATPase
MIKQLEVRGYRLLDGFTADFGDVTVVIGANATGKSTLLDCLELICQTAEFPVNEVLLWHGGMASISNAFGVETEFQWRLTFAKPSALSMWTGIPLEKEVSFVYEVVLGQDAYGQAVLGYEVLRNAEPYQGYTEPFKYLESTRTRSKIFDPKKHGFVDFDSTPAGIQQDFVRDADGSAAEEAANSMPQAAGGSSLLLLPRMRFVNEYPQPSYMRILLAGCASYPGFEVTRGSAVRTKPAEIRSYTLLLASGENLATVLHEVLTRHAFKETGDEIQEFLASAYPSFGGIYAETAYGAAGKVVVRWREKGAQRLMELGDLSDGVLRFLCLATALLNPMPPPFIGIDEPEAGLHPRLLPVVADMIKTASEKTQVLVTTHSPDLVNCFDLHDIAVMSREEARAVWHRPASRASLRKMLEAVGGDTLGDLHRSGELEAMAE